MLIIWCSTSKNYCLSNFQ